MPNGWFLKTSPLFAAAAAASASGLMIGAAPAQALPPAPLAPGNCQQWGFGPAETVLLNNTGVVLRFNSTGPAASGPATWINNLGKTVEGGTVTGSVDPNGHVDLTYQDPDKEDAGFLYFKGDVGADGKASGANWHTSSPLTCVTQAAMAKKEGPSFTLDPGLGSLTIHVTDHSGETSQCHYSSDFVQRNFKLEKNSTFDIKVVPAVPLGIDHQVDITCENGAETHQTVNF